MTAAEQRYDIRIAADGSWWHEGRPIRRSALVKLFASILRRAPDGSFWLETPAERGRIEVEDAPFTVVEVWREGAFVWFRTNLDAVVPLDADHSLRMAEAKDGPRAYIQIRPGVEARLLRAPFYDLVGFGEERDGMLEVESAGRRHRLGEVG
ncbi:MAG: DUF1285 domain-containing protein [Pseudomonadota bacterium]